MSNRVIGQFQSNRYPILETIQAIYSSSFRQNDFRPNHPTQHRKKVLNREEWGHLDNCLTFLNVPSICLRYLLFEIAHVSPNILLALAQSTSGRNCDFEAVPQVFSHLHELKMRMHSFVFCPPGVHLTAECVLFSCSWFSGIGLCGRAIWKKPGTSQHFKVDKTWDETGNIGNSLHPEHTRIYSPCAKFKSESFFPRAKS